MCRIVSIMTGCRCSLYGAARFVLGHRYTATKITTNEKRITIRASMSRFAGSVKTRILALRKILALAEPYNDYQKTIVSRGFSRAVARLMLIPMLLMATKYAGEFQELGVGGRACAMGGTGVAQFVDPSVIYFNPAGSFYASRSVLLMHAENFAGIVKNEFGSVILPRENMSIGIGLQYLSVNGIKFTSLADTTSPPNSENPPIPYDTVGTTDLVFYVNGAKGNDNISYGANIKVFYRDLSVITGYGGGVDLGLALNMNYLIVGFAVRDFILSPIIWSNGTKETIIPKLSLGVAPVVPLENINSLITLECDITKAIDVDGFDVNMGFEYAYKDFVFGRIGINRGDYTLGAGLRYKRFCLDYALVTHSELQNSSKISAGFTF